LLGEGVAGLVGVMEGTGQVPHRDDDPAEDAQQ
jgi:hypothetical protein